jgi:hypothetical protein
MNEKPEVPSTEMVEAMSRTLIKVPSVWAFMQVVPVTDQTRIAAAKLWADLQIAALMCRETY